MEIKAYSNLQEFYGAIDPLLAQKSWTGVTVGGLEELIHMNLRLLVNQTEAGDTAQGLQNKLKQLSERINENFDNTAGHNLAFELQGIAQGIFSSPEAKVDFTNIPTEILQKILAELTPKGTQVVPNVPNDGIISSGLKDARLVAKKLQFVAEKTKKDWISEEAISLRASGCKNGAEAVDYIINNKLLSANLLEFTDVTDDDLKKLADKCPNLKRLFIKSDTVTDKTLEHFKGMPLTSVIFSSCSKITDQGLEHFKGMPLTSVAFIYCDNITDQGLAHFKGMPLTNVNFSACSKITDQGLENFKGMPLTNVNLIFCNKITDQGLENFKGMPLTVLNLSLCPEITDQGLENFKGMPLTSIGFAVCPKITDQGLAHFEGMPLTSVDFSFCTNITDQGLKHFKGMPLTTVTLNGCYKITEQAIKDLKVS